MPSASSKRSRPAAARSGPPTTSFSPQMSVPEGFPAPPSFSQTAATADLSSQPQMPAADGFIPSRRFMAYPPDGLQRPTMGAGPRVGLAHPRPGQASQRRGKRPMTVDEDSAGVDFSPMNDHEEDFSAEMNFYTGMNLSTGTMGGGGYFSNLINDGSNSNSGWAGMGSQHQYEMPHDDSNSGWPDMGSQSHVEVPRDVERNRSVRPNHRRTKNFSDEEDTLLVSAWLNISLDAVQGTEQSRATYWKRIHEYFHMHKTFNSDRSEKSLSHRWQVIQEGVNKFCGYYSQVQNRNQSGATNEDKYAQAVLWYKHEEEKAFHLGNCYNLLKHQPKWIARVKELAAAKAAKKKHKAATNGTLGTDTHVDERVDADTDASTHTAGRPLGRKKEKEKKRQRSDQSRTESLDYLWGKKKEADAEKELKKEERYNRAFAMEEERMKMEKDKFLFKRMIEEERIVRMDTSGMTILEQEYYRDLKDKILSRRMDE